MVEAKQEGKIVRKQGDGDESKRKPGILRWIIGWVVVPVLVLGAIFGTGLHLGANNPEAWYTRAVMWIAGLFA